MRDNNRHDDGLIPTIQHSLRDEAITHMAVSLAALDGGWSDLGDKERAGLIDDATFLIDEHLDFLDAHTEEWAPSVVTIGEPGYSITVGTRTICEELVAALRGTTEEES